MQGNRQKGLDGKKLILVVDDEPDIVSYMETVLEDNGYRTVHAHSAGEALDEIEKARPDLIILDIMMPKQSGIALYQKLKMNEDKKDIPVIFLSAFSMAEDFTGKRFRKLIPDRRVPEPIAYIEKPVDVPGLLAEISNVIGAAHE